MNILDRPFLTKEQYAKAKSNGISGNLLYLRYHQLKWDVEVAMTKKPRPKREYRMNTQYAVYKADKFVVQGNARQCAKHMGIKLASFYHLLTPAYERRMKKMNAKKYTTVVEVENDQARA